MTRRLAPLILSTLLAASCAVVPCGAAQSRVAQPVFRDKQLFKGKVSAGVTQGERALLAGKYDEAATLFGQAINRNSKDAAAWCGRGFAYTLSFKLDAADEQFNKALGLDSKNSLAHVGRALVRLNRLQSSSMTIIKQRQSSLSQAESECRLALKGDANSPEAHIVLGMVLKEQGRLAEAAAAFNKAIESDRKYSQAYAQLGIIQLKQGSPAQAAASFKQAIALRSNNATAHYGLGKAYLDQGMVNEALAALNTALSLNRNSAPIHTARGDAFRLQGNTNAALNEYREAIRIKAETEEAYMRMADIREDRGDLELAVAELRGGVELNPGSLPLHQRLADILLRLEKTDDAIKEYNTIQTISPGDAASIKGLTRAYVIKAQKEATGAFFVSNNFEAAEKMIQQAIKLNPSDMELRLADAKLRAISGRPVDFSTVGAPANDAERIAYAEALLSQQNFDEASKQMSTVIGNASNAKQTLAIADMAAMIHDLDSAEAAYKKAAAFPEAQARSKRGLYQVSQLRAKADSDLTLAKDLLSKKQLASAVDKFRSAAYQNPRLAEAHRGLAEALQKLFPKRPDALREAAQHLRSYINLDKNLPDKEREKLERHAQKLIEKAYKIEQKQASGN